MTKVLDLLDNQEQQSRLLDLLDTQGCVFLEQVWVQNEQSNAPFTMDAHWINGQPQMNDISRLKYGIAARNSRAMMLGLDSTQTLLDRMSAALPSTNGEG